MKHHGASAHEWTNRMESFNASWSFISPSLPFWKPVNYFYPDLFPCLTCDSYNPWTVLACCLPENCDHSVCNSVCFGRWTGSSNSVWIVDNPLCKTVDWLFGTGIVGLWTLRLDLWKTTAYPWLWLLPAPQILLSRILWLLSLQLTIHFIQWLC